MSDYTTERIWDHRVVVATISELWDEVAEDDAPPYVPDIVGEYYIGVFYQKNYIGMYRFNQLTSVCWEGHVFMLDRQHSINAADAIKKWVVENLTGAKKVIVNIPECFPNVIEFVKEIGFKEQGYNSESYTKNKIVGTYQLGMKVEEMRWEQQAR